MDRLDRIVKKAARAAAEAAGWCLFACMLLVTVNVILRKVFNSPLLGAYEWAGILTAVAIGLGLAYCAAEGAHIAVDFIVEKMPPRIRRAAAVLSGCVSVLIMTGVSVGVFSYAGSLAVSGEVSPTTRIPFYWFVFLIGAGFVLMTAVLFVNLIKTVRRKNTNES